MQISYENQLYNMPSSKGLQKNNQGPSSPLFYLSNPVHCYKILAGEGKVEFALTTKGILLFLTQNDSNHLSVQEI